MTEMVFANYPEIGAPGGNRTPTRGVEVPGSGLRPLEPECALDQGH